MTTGISKGSQAGLVCVSVAQPSVEQALAAAETLAGQADVIEIRLDALAQPAVAPFMARLATPLLFTNRPQWEGGRHQGDETSRGALLLEAAHSGCAYVDLELKADSGLRRELLATATTTRVILSWHNFDQTPDDATLAEILAQQQQSGAHIGKLITMAHSWQDVLRVLHLQLAAAAMNFPLIAFCMGSAGVISRLATLELGGYMTYAAPEAGGATAPGQLPVATLNRLRAALRHEN
jgi:3-dehydroquinate dehydratase-1/3-dehydroquinate dehydratase/shikimate dehydrogenase